MEQRAQGSGTADLKSFLRSHSSRWFCSSFQPVVLFIICQCHAVSEGTSRFLPFAFLSSCHFRPHVPFQPSTRLIAPGRSLAVQARPGGDLGVMSVLFVWGYAPRSVLWCLAGFSFYAWEERERERERERDAVVCFVTYSFMESFCLFTCSLVSFVM